MKTLSRTNSRRLDAARSFPQPTIAYVCATSARMFAGSSPIVESRLNGQAGSLSLKGLGIGYFAWARRRLSFEKANHSLAEDMKHAIDETMLGEATYF